MPPGKRQLTSYDFVDKTTQVEDSVSDSQAASLRTPGTNKICSAVGLIERVMNDMDYRLHYGEVYRKVPQAKFTFVRTSSVNDFVHALLSNSKMAEVIAPQISSVIGCLETKENEENKENPIIWIINIITINRWGGGGRGALAQYISALS